MANLSNLFQTKQPNSILANLVKPSALSSSSDKSEVSFHENFMQALQNKAKPSQEVKSLNSKPVAAEPNTAEAKPAQEFDQTTPQKTPAKFGNLQQNAIKTNQTTIKNANLPTNKNTLDNELPDYTTEELIAKLEQLSVKGFTVEELEADGLPKTGAKKSTSEDETNAVMTSANNEALLATLQMLNAKSSENAPLNHQSNNAEKLFDSGNAKPSSIESNIMNTASNLAKGEPFAKSEPTYIPSQELMFASAETNNTIPTYDVVQKISTSIENKNNAINLRQEDTALTPQALQTNANHSIPLQQAQSMQKDIIAPRFGSEGWNNSIQQKVVWMVGQEQQSATVTLNPPDLGPLQIVINVSNDQTDAAFFSDNQEVRQALQDGLENLRESMKEAGIQLGQANVGEHPQTAPQETIPIASPRSDASDPLATSLQEAPTVTRVSRGLLDTFA